MGPKLSGMKNHHLLKDTSPSFDRFWRAVDLSELVLACSVVPQQSLMLIQCSFLPPPALLAHTAAHVQTSVGFTSVHLDSHVPDLNTTARNTLLTGSTSCATIKTRASLPMWRFQTFLTEFS